MRRRARRTAVAAAVLVVALAVAAPVYQHEARRPQPTAKQTVDGSIAAGRLLFVGASYSIGVGATGPAATIPDLVAKRLGRTFRVDAVSGTGYQNPGRPKDGRAPGTFAERLALDPADPAPRIVVIQGGRDDVGFPPEKEYDAVVATIRLAQQRFPHAQVVLLGPIPATLPVSPRVAAIRGEIRRAAADAGAGFVDPIAEQWITPQNAARYRGKVPGHPNDAGYAYLTGRLVDALPAALAAAHPPVADPTLDPVDSPTAPPSAGATPSPTDGPTDGPMGGPAIGAAPGPTARGTQAPAAR